MSAGSSLAAFLAGYIEARKVIINDAIATRDTVFKSTSEGKSVKKINYRIK